MENNIEMPQINMDNMNLDLTQGLISKTKIWRAGIYEVKQQLLKSGHTNICFSNYLAKEDSIKTIDENNYEIHDIVDVKTSTGKIKQLHFDVAVHIQSLGNCNWDYQINNIKVEG